MAGIFYACDLPLCLFITNFDDLALIHNKPMLASNNPPTAQSFLRPHLLA